MNGSNTKIITAYEDSKCFAEIGKCADLLEFTGGIPAPEESNAIDFSRFWTEQTWGTAVTASQTANVIIVSLSGRTDLPMPVQRWIESLPNYEPMNHPALVVVFGGDEANVQKQNDLISFFQQIAESHGLNFFCNRIEPQTLLSQSLASNLN